MSELKMTVTSWGELVQDKRALKALMRGAGNDIKSKTGRLISATSGSGRTYRGGGGSAYRGAYKAGHYTASAPGAPPVRVTQSLKSSLKAYVYPSAEGFAVRAREFYALFLEVGARGGGNRYGGRPAAAAAARAGRSKRARGTFMTRVLLPRPFLDRVMAQEQGNLNRRVREALDKGLKWRQTA